MPGKLLGDAKLWLKMNKTLLVAKYHQTLNEQREERNNPDRVEEPDVPKNGL